MVDDRTAAYAAGIYEIARGEGVEARVESELFQIARAFESNPELRSTLTDQALPLERRQAIISDLIGTRAADTTVNVLDLLVANGRIGELGEIAAAMADHAAASSQKQIAVVRSAIALDDNTVERLAAALQKATGKAVEVRVVVDESVMGGLVATVGDTVIDGSVRTRVDQLKSRL